MLEWAETVFEEENILMGALGCQAGGLLGDEDTDKDDLIWGDDDGII